MKANIKTDKSNIGRPHVLLLEDDNWFLELLTDQLGLINATYTHVVSPHDIFGSIAKTTPDVIVLDIHLPIQNSLSVIHELKSYEDTARIPLIICSNAVDPLIEQALQNYGVNKVLQKDTMQPSDIAAAVVVLLSNKVSL